MLPLKDDIPTNRFPVLTVTLILVNVIMFVAFQKFFGDRAAFERNAVDYGAIPFEIAHPGDNAAGEPPTWLTLFTSMFMHGGILHLAGNMLFLWVFGNNVEDSMGRPRFLAFYVLGGIVALLAQTALDPDSVVPTIGASGAVAAVLGGYALLYPRARVVTLVFIVIFITVIQLPALLVLGAWFVLQALSAAADLSHPVGDAGGGIAYFAHLGGFLFGLAAIKLFADRVHEDYERAHRTPVYR